MEQVTQEQNRALFQWTAVIMLLNLGSRLLGFGREMAIAYSFGATAEVDAYVVAMLIPTIFYVSVREAVRTVFITVYGRYKDSEHDRHLLLNTVALLLAAVLIVVFVLAATFTPQLIRVIAPGFDAGTLETAVYLMRILLPATVFLGLAGLFAGYLHSHHRYLAPALVGVPFNLFIIASALYGAHYLGIEGLAVGSLLGFLSMFFIQLPATLRLGLAPRRGLSLQHPGIKQMGGLLTPVVISTAALELKQLIDRSFASTLPEGYVAVVNYAERVFNLPYNIVILALLTVLYPTLVEHYSRGDTTRFKEDLNLSLRVTAFMMLPMLAGLAVLSEPIIRLVFERGAFGAGDTASTAYALVFFSLGLLGLGLRFLLDRAFIVMYDTRTPMLATLFMVALNVVLNFVLIGPLQQGGIALATSLSLTAGSAVLAVILHRRMKPLGWLRFFKTLLRSAAAAAVMAVALWYLYPLLQESWSPESFTGQALQMALLIGGGGLLYFAITALLKAEELWWVLRHTRTMLQGLISRK